MSVVKRIEQRETAPGRKTACKLVCQFIQAEYLPEDSRLVQLVTAQDWAQVAQFFECVEEGTDVRRFVRNAPDGFDKFARNLMAAKNFKSCMLKDGYKAVPPPAPPPICHGGAYLAYVLVPLGVLALLLAGSWSLGIVSTALWGSRVEVPTGPDHMDLIRGLNRTVTSLAQVVTDMQARVGIVENSFKAAEAGRNRRFEAWLEKKQEANAQAISEFETKAKGIIQKTDSSVNSISTRLGDAVALAESKEAKLDEWTVQTVSLQKELKEVSSRVPALKEELVKANDGLLTVQDQAKKIMQEQAIATVQLQETNERYMLMLIGGVVFVALVGGCSICEVQAKGRELDANFALVASHNLVRRVQTLEEDKKARDERIAEEEAAEEPPAGAGGPARRGRPARV